MDRSDAILFQRWIATRDADAFAEVVSRHSAMVYGTCKRIIGNPSDAEDIAQECFMELARVKRTIRPSLGGWLHTVATRRSLDRIKADRRRKRREVRFVERVGMNNEITWDDIQTHIDEAIAALPDKLREPIIYRFLGGQTQNVIAQKLGISSSTVQYRLTKGIEQMRKFLKKRGVVAPSAVLVSLLGTHLAAEAAPATLTAALGKLTLAGATGAMGGVAGTSATGIAALGGVLIMKKVAIVIAVILAGGVGMWAVRQKQRPESTESAHSAASLALERVSRTESPGPSEAVHEPLAAIVARTEAPQMESQMVATAVEREGASVSGIVLLPGGQPAKGAQVIAYTEEPEFRVSGLADRDGTFELAGFTVGSHLYLYAETDEFTSKLHGPIPLTEGGLQNFTIALFELGGIRGVVVDMQGHAVVLAGLRARPHAYASTPPIPVAYTDETGNFALTNLLPGLYGFGLIPPGSEDRTEVSSRESVKVNAGEVRTDVTLVLDMGGDLSIRGSVTDSEGNPIANARIEIDRRIAGRREWRTQTDQDGNYCLTGLSDTTYAVRGYCTGYAPGGEWKVPAGSENVDFVLRRMQTTFTGRVVRADTGEPVTEFEVLAVGSAITDRAQLRQYEKLSFETCKDPEGRFQIKGLGGTGGKWATVVARAAGFAMGYDTVRMNPEGPFIEALVRLEPEALVTGIVVDAAEEPVPGANVLIGPLVHFPNIPDRTAAHSRDDGTFELYGVSSETRVISAYHPDYAPCSVQVSPRPGETESVRIVLLPGGVVEGMVTAGGEPVTDAIVWLQPPRDLGEWTLDTRTDFSGRFRFASVAPGSMEASAFFPRDRKDGSIRRLTRPVPIENGRVTQVDFDFALASAELEGIVCFGDLPAKEGFARVYIASAEGEEFRSVSFEESAFRIEDLPAGTARLEISAFFPDLRNIVRRKDVDVLLNDNEPTQITVDFAQGGRLGGIVTGIPPSEAWVDVFSGAVDVAELYGDPSPMGEAFEAFGRLLVWQGSAQQDGTFYAVGFDPGTYTVVVSLSRDDASTPAEARAGLRQTSLVVQVADAQETWVEMPFR